MNPRIGFTIWRKDLGRIRDLVEEFIVVGIDHVEIDIDSILELEKPEWLRTFRDLLSSYRISIGFHGPWKEIYIASPVEDVRRASVEIIRKTIQRLREVGVSEYEYIVLHGASEQPLCDEDPSLCISSLARSMEELLKLDQKIVVETIQGRCCGKIDQLEELIKRIPESSICIDLAHVYAENYRFRNFENISQVLEIIPEKILERSRVIHLHGLIREGSRFRSHRNFSQTPLDTLKLAKLLTRSPNIRFLVFEVFYGDNDRISRPSDLSREIKNLRTHLSQTS
ncbi:MAG: TIM barrel protein [Sulfolobales archaeon]